MREKPTPDTSQITHKRPIGAEETSSQGEQGLHHQRDMTFYNTLFLNGLHPIIHPVVEVGGQLLGETLGTELPHASPVRAHDLANIGNTI